MNARILHTAIAALATLAIVGCGGDDSDDGTTETPAVATTPTTSTLTKEELLSQGDAICAEVNAALGTVGSAEGTDSAAIAEQEADLYAGMVERLKSLGTPQEAAGYQDFIAAAERLAEAQDAVGLAAAREDSVALQNAEADASAALEEFSEAADEYGFKECGGGPSTPARGGAGGGEAGGEAVEESAPETEPSPEAESAPPTPETGGAGTESGGGAAPGGGAEAGGGAETGGGSGGIGPG